MRLAKFNRKLCVQRERNEISRTERPTKQTNGNYFMCICERENRSKMQMNIKLFVYFSLVSTNIYSCFILFYTNEEQTDEKSFTHAFLFRGNFTKKKHSNDLLAIASVSAAVNQVEYSSLIFNI